MTETAAKIFLNYDKAALLIVESNINSSLSPLPFQTLSKLHTKEA